MFRVIYHEGNIDIPLCAWFVREETAKEYAEALKDTADRYTIAYTEVYGDPPIAWTVIHH